MSGRRLGRILLVLLLAVVAYACSDLLVTPARVGDHQLSVSLAGRSETAGPGDAFDQADRLRIRVRQGESILKDTTLAFASAGAETRIQLLLQRSLAGEAVSVDVELLLGDAALFQGTSTVTLIDVGNTVAAVPLSPVVASVTVPDSIGPVQSLGTILPLTGTTLFATGDTITTVPLVWRVIDPGILELSSAATVVARGEGRARVEASAGSLADTTVVVVRAVVASVEVTPQTLTLEVGASETLSATPRDANGNALAGRSAVWSSSDASVAEVDAARGLVLGVAAGSAVLTAEMDGGRGESRISIVNPGPVLRELEPNSAVEETSAVVLVLRGSGFTTQSRVRWRGALRVPQYVGPTELRLSLNASDLTPAGVVGVSVESPAPGGGTSSALPFTVTRRPAIDLSRAEIAFSGRSGGSDPAALAVEIANSGDGVLSGLSSSIQYTSGQPTGWLSASLSSTAAPATLTLRSSLANLAPGTYRATVSVASAVAGNSPRQVSVSLLVAPDPRIALSPSSIGFDARTTGTVPDAQVVDVTNSGTGTLSGITGTVAYGAGQPSGWLSATLNTTTAPARLTLRPTTTSLPVGTYTATVSIASAEASNSPQQVTVSYVVAPDPRIALSSNALTFSAPNNGIVPDTQTVQVTNGGSGTLTGLGRTVTYGAGQPTGWLSATLSGTTAPAQLHIRPTTTSLPVGTYTATVAVTSSVASNSPSQVTVTYTVAADPRIALSPSSIGFDARTTGTVPDAQVVDVTNSGTGTLSGITGTVAYGAGQPSGWLSATLNTTTAPARLTLRPTTTSLPVGTYTATVSIASAEASNSPQQVTVSYVVAPDPRIALSSNALTFSAPNNGIVPDTQTVQVTNGGSGTLTGLGRTVTYGAGQPTGWLSATLSGTTAPTQLHIRPTTTSLPVGTYTATVAVTSSVASNSPSQVTVTYTVAVPFSLWLAEGNYQDSGNADNDGAPVGTVTFGSGFRGQAFRFGGAASPAEIITFENGLASASQVTLATWVNLDPNESGAGVRRFVSLLPERAVLRLDGQFGGSLAGANSLHFYVSTSNGSVGIYADDVLTGRGCWMHVAGTFDGSTARLYLDGYEVASTSVSGTLNPGTGQGIKLSNDDGGGVETLNGSLDEVRVYGRAASAAEIANWAAETGAGLKCPAS